MIETSNSGNNMSQTEYIRRPSNLPLIEETEDGWLDLSSNLSAYPPADSREGRGVSSDVRIGASRVRQQQRHDDSRDDDLLGSHDPTVHRNAAQQAKRMERAMASFLAGMMTKDEEDDGNNDGGMNGGAGVGFEKRACLQRQKRGLLVGQSSPKIRSARSA
uniref:Uncharacterized protein n=1 Tax=Pseudictyota dubia TaxID=2749911 RepID=A0A7R9Z173_9STRA|mmetsp:Transcript_1657/g.2836  ORF Transcript_1657/g.2836 Transcript_1657/m.2836 type:complete len:161 (+) Transcript_1657:176-658(+)